MRCSAGSSCSIRLRATNTLRSRSMPVGAGGIGDEQLAEGRHHRPGGGAEAVGFDRHVAPAEHGEALVGDDRLDRRHRLLGVARGSAGRNAMPDRVVRRPAAARTPTTLAGTRSGTWIRMPAPSPVSASAPVAPRCSRLQSAPMPMATMDRLATPLMLRHERDATGVVFESWVVETRGPGQDRCASSSSTKS